MNASELFQEHLKRENTFRMDLYALSQFVKARASSGVADAVSSTELFWETLRPRADYLDDRRHKFPFGYDEEPQALPDDMESRFLEILAEQERECRIHPSPDTDDWRNGTTMEQFNAGSQYIHVGAASALRQWRRYGLFSEYVRQTLQEVVRVLYLLGIDYMETEKIYRSIYRMSGIVSSLFDLNNVEGAGGDVVSLWGVRALVLNKLLAIKTIDRDYDEAFRLGTEAVALFEYVSEAANIDEESLIKDGIVEDYSLEEDQKIRSAIRAHLKPEVLEPQWIVDAFEGLKGLEDSDNWLMVARNCRLLAYSAVDVNAGLDLTHYRRFSIDPPLAVISYSGIPPMMD